MLKNLKRWFIVDDEEFKKNMETGKGGTTESSSKNTEETIKTEKTTPTHTAPSSSSVPNIPTGKATSKFTNVLLGAMDANNLEGFDYLEYKRSLHNLQKMPMDEQTRYQSAFAAAQTMGATPTKLIKTAQHYIDVLKNEQNKFGQALANQKAKQIGDKEQQIKQLDALIKEKTNQINQLQKEIAKHQTQSTTLKKSISEAAVKVGTTKNNFEASYNLLLSQIQRDIENMKKYLK